MENQDMQKDKKLLAYIFIVPFILLFVFNKFIPLFYIILLSFFKCDLQSLGIFSGLQNFIAVFTDAWFWKFFFNTLIIVFYTTVISMLISIPVASLMEKVQKKLRIIIFFTILFPCFVYLTHNTVLLKWLFGQDFFTDAFSAKLAVSAVAAWSTIGIAVLILVLLKKGIHDPEDNRNKLSGLIKTYYVPVIVIIIFYLFFTFSLSSNIINMAAAEDAHAAITTLGGFLDNNAFQLFEYGQAAVIGFFISLVIVLLCLALFRILKDVNFSFAPLFREPVKLKNTHYNIITGIVITFSVLLIAPYIWAFICSFNNEWGMFVNYTDLFSHLPFGQFIVKDMVFSLLRICCHLVLNFFTVYFIFSLLHKHQKLIQYSLVILFIPDKIIMPAFIFLLSQLGLIHGIVPYLIRFWISGIVLFLYYFYIRNNSLLNENSNIEDIWSRVKLMTIINAFIIFYLLVNNFWSVTVTRIHEILQGPHFAYVSALMMLTLVPVIVIYTLLVLAFMQHTKPVFK